MSAVKPDTTGLEVSRSQPEFTIQLWQYLNRATSDWKIAAGREKAKQYAPLLAHIEKRFRRRASFHARRVGHRVRRSAIQSSRKITCVRSSRRWRRSPGPSRAAAGTGRSELINALTIVQSGWARPRRWSAHGLAPWATRNGCRKSGCMSESTMMATARFRPTVRPTMHSLRPRGISSSAASIGAASTGVARCAWPRKRGERAFAHLRRMAKTRRRPRRRRAVPTAEREGEALGAGARRSRISDRPELHRGQELQSIDDLRAGARAISATAASAASRSCNNFPAASVRRRSPKCRKFSAGSPRSASTQAAPRPDRHRHRDRRAQLSA